MQLLPNFLVDAVMLGSLYCLMAIGLALAFGVTRIINFAHGEFIMLGAYAAVMLSRTLGFDPLISIPFAAAGAALLGWLLFQLTLKRVLRAPAINQILLLFGIGLVLQNVALIAFTADERSVTTAYSLRRHAMVRRQRLVRQARRARCLDGLHARPARVAAP